MTKKFIKIEKKKNGVFELIFNNPQSRNALNKIMLKEISESLDDLKLNKKLRILIITGVGKTFSAGADLDWMKAAKNLSLEDNKKDALYFSEMIKKIDEFSKPTLALINGHVFGGGLGIVSACDFSLAEENAKFCFSEVRLGLIPAMIGPYVVRSIGLANSRKLFLTGKVFDTKHALKINLIDEALPLSMLIDKKEELVNELLMGAPKAQEEIKNFLFDITNKDINESLINKTSQTIANIRTSSEGQEGIDAFLNKRKPSWQNGNS
jgi:methylglutaconyl-CoA hydratase